MKRPRALRVQCPAGATGDRIGAVRLRLEPPHQSRLRTARTRGDGGGTSGVPVGVAQPAGDTCFVSIAGRASGACAVVALSAPPASHSAVGGGAAALRAGHSDVVDYARRRYALRQSLVWRDRFIHANDARVLVAARHGNPPGAAASRGMDAPLFGRAFLAAHQGGVSPRRTVAVRPCAARSASRAAWLSGSDARDQRSGAPRDLGQGYLDCGAPARRRTTPEA